MGTTRRNVLTVMGGGALAAGLWTNKRQLRETFDYPRYESTGEVTLPAGVVYTSEFGFEASRPTLFEYTLEVDQGAVRAGLAKGTDGGYTTAFAGDLMCPNSAGAGETSTAKCTLDPGDYIIIIRSASSEDAALTYTKKLY